ncbi:hypothetical protein Pse7429DRAFT_2117 [Pseudanabaena biceps PCC 7429]|uniref:Uncharacterized protein n=1 Tax=Pseudanabaena biceps PCC 7429 TaxID=927668 RepID=L8N338_9CYAN|nr:hypothetical protein Pse7429DRAFT_2117 [Pseudanabaena biceps PCC 7429]
MAKITILYNFLGKEQNGYTILFFGIITSWLDLVLSLEQD